MHRLQRVLNRHFSRSVEVFLERRDVCLWIAAELRDALRDAISRDNQTELTERILTEKLPEEFIHECRDDR